jgi:hypothetical protein
MFVCLFVCLLACLLVCLFVCLFVCLVNYGIYFVYMSGNLAAALHELRPPQLSLYGLFRGGFVFGITLMLLLGVIVVLLLRRDLVDLVQVEVAMPVFIAFGMRHRFCLCGVLVWFGLVCCSLLLCIIRLSLFCCRIYALFYAQMQACQ